MASVATKTVGGAVAGAIAVHAPGGTGAVVETAFVNVTASYAGSMTEAAITGSVDAEGMTNGFVGAYASTGVSTVLGGTTVGQVFNASLVSSGAGSVVSEFVSAAVTDDATATDAAAAPATPVASETNECMCSQ